MAKRAAQVCRPRLAELILPRASNSRRDVLGLFGSRRSRQKRRPTRLSCEIHNRFRRPVNIVRVRVGGSIGQPPSAGRSLGERAEAFASITSVAGRAADASIQGLGRSTAAPPRSSAILRPVRPVTERREAVSFDHRAASRQRSRPYPRARQTEFQASCRRRRTIVRSPTPKPRCASSISCLIFRPIACCSLLIPGLDALVSARPGTAHCAEELPPITQFPPPRAGTANSKSA